MIKHIAGPLPVDGHTVVRAILQNGKSRIQPASALEWDESDAEPPIGRQVATFEVLAAITAA